MSGDERFGDESFFARVYALVRCVPRGRVVTYGQVAAMLGVPRGARAVGWARRALPEDEAARVPWHRVVGTGGRISPRRGPGPEIQRRRLRAEKVAFCGDCVDMHGSFTRPRERPSERLDLGQAGSHSGRAGKRTKRSRAGTRPDPRR
jgi:methylated-DNA-protein-cysteine methyltransferase-like protein